MARNRAEVLGAFIDGPAPCWSTFSPPAGSDLSREECLAHLSGVMSGTYVATYGQDLTRDRVRALDCNTDGETALHQLVALGWVQPAPEPVLTAPGGEA